jgi:hypothetical protein
LAYPSDTPEKTFCKADITRRNDLHKFTIAFTSYMNYGLDVQQSLSAMGYNPEKQKSYLNFGELFDDVANEEMFGRFDNQQSYLIARTRYEFTFTVWLQEYRGLEYGNEDQYIALLTKENLAEFVKSEKEKESRILSLASFSDAAYKVYQENYSALRKRFRVRRKANKEDCQTMPRLREGDIIEFNPDYNTSIEAFTLLTEYYAMAYLELEKYLFLELYKIWNVDTIKSEIIEIENFINDAAKLSLADACKAYGSFGNDNSKFVYLRLKCGFYQNLEISKYPLISAIGNSEAQVYGRYFLFYEYLKKAQIETEDLPKSVFNLKEKGQTDANVESQDLAPAKLKVKQVALIHVYEGKQITRGNAPAIAEGYGYRSKTSGEALFQDYTTFSNPTLRKGRPTLCTPKKLRNKIDLFESVIEYLSEKARQRAQDEIKILKNIFESEYQ